MRMFTALKSRSVNQVYGVTLVCCKSLIGFVCNFKFIQRLNKGALVLFEVVFCNRDYFYPISGQANEYRSMLFIYSKGIN